MTDPSKMTLDECRDWVAENSGEWTRKGGMRWCHRVWHRLGSGQKRHPFPPTIDAAAEAMPEGWDWSVCKGMDVSRNYSAEAFDTKATNGHEFVEDCETELLVRWRLVVACRLAEKRAGGGE